MPCCSPSASLGRLAGLPAPVPPIYSVLLVMFVLLFAGSYAWLARQPEIDRPLVALAGIGKAGAFAAVLGCWLFGQAAARRHRFRRRPDLRRHLRLVAVRSGDRAGGERRSRSTRVTPRRALGRVASATALALALLAMLRPTPAWPLGIPGTSYGATPPPLSAAERALRDRLRAHVETLRDPDRRAQLAKLRRARARPSLHRAPVPRGRVRAALPLLEHKGEPFHNVEAVLGSVGSRPESIVVGAHYDSVEGSPGANDNASGVAALLELSRLLRGRSLPLAVRFVAFVNEEPPYFNTGEGMGSVEYVRELERRSERVRAMLSLETVGLYSNEPGSQRYPPLVGSFYPERGNFIAFVGDLGAVSLVQQAVASFRRVATLPSEGAALPSFVPGISWSDHRSFSAAGIPALMVTDTAPFRDPHYHLVSDTPDRLDYDSMARLVVGLAAVVEDLARGKSSRQD